MITKKERRIKIKHRIRKKVNGTASRPRLTVFRSNKAIYAQVVNDLEGKKTEVAKKVGQAVAEKCAAAGITEVVFDRNGYLYHGRVQALAEGAREGGLKF